MTCHNVVIFQVDYSLELWFVLSIRLRYLLDKSLSNNSFEWFTHLKIANSSIRRLSASATSSTAVRVSVLSGRSIQRSLRLQSMYIYFTTTRCTRYISRMQGDPATTTCARDPRFKEITISISKGLSLVPGASQCSFTDKKRASGDFESYTFHPSISTIYAFNPTIRR